MKVLKILAAVLLLILAFLLSACDSYDDNFSSYYFARFGTLTKEGRTYYISFDDESASCKVSDSTAIVRAEIGKTPQRVLACYSDLSLPQSGTGTVNLLEITPMITSGLSSAPVTEEERERLGTSGVTVSRAWIGGGYLNVALRYPCTPSAGTAGVLTAFDAGTNAEGYRIYELRCLFQSSEKSQWTPQKYVSFALPLTYLEETFQYGGEYRGALLCYIGEDGEFCTMTIEQGGTCQVIE